MKMKEELLKFLMEHYSKFKVSQEGAAIQIEADLAFYNDHILRFNLQPSAATPEVQSEIEMNEGTFELLKACVRLFSAEP